MSRDSDSQLSSQPGWHIVAGVAITLLSVPLVVTLVSPTSAVAATLDELPPAPDHGVNPETFDRLWAGVDTRASEGDADGSSGPLTVVDYTFQRPPDDVTRWTAGDHRDVPRTGPRQSIVPPAATPVNRAWIRDAHLTIFAIQPSTQAHITGSTTRRYIRSAGVVRGVADYRVAVPPTRIVSHSPLYPSPGETTKVRTTHRWSLKEHELSAVSLLADGTTVATTAGSHRPQLRFSSLPQDTASLTLRAEVSVTLRHEIERTYRRARRVCEVIGGAGSSEPERQCYIEYDTYSRTTVRSPSASVFLQDTVSVDVYTLASAATEVSYADGDTGLSISQGGGDPWALARISDSETVHSTWHFYSAPRPGWATVEVRSDSGTSQRRSDAIPLQVHAFPSTGSGYLATDVPSRTTVTEVRGTTRQPPTLPSEIAVPVATDAYQAGTITVRSPDELPEPESVTVHGLVAGAQQAPSDAGHRTIWETNLTLDIIDQNHTSGTARIRVTLQEGESGTPIALTDRPGAITVRNVTLKPGSDGTATATVPLGTGAITARYEPGPWYETSPAYAPARATATVPVEWPAPLEIVVAGSKLLLVLSPLLLGIYLVDRVMGRGRLWPPWRGLR